MRGRNSALSVILIFGVIVMLAVTILLIKYPDINTRFVIGEDDIDRDRVVIIDDNNNYDNKDRLSYTITHESALDGKIDIEYPVISGYSDVNFTNNINTKLCVNATGILALHKLKDKINSLDINCTIKEFSDEKIVVVYEGELMYNSSTTKSAPKNNTNYDTYDEYKPSTKSSNGNYGYDPNYDNYGGGGITYNGSGDPNYDNYSGVSNITNINQNQNINQYAPNANSSNPQFYQTNDANAPMTNALPNANLYPGGNTLQGFAGTKFDVERIYYTNTVDLTNCKDIYLSQYVDTSVLSSLIKANDKEKIDIICDDETEARKYLTKESLNTIKSNIDNTDFRNQDLTKWPSCFSYSDNEYVYISYPVSEKLGNYVIVKYKYN